MRSGFLLTVAVVALSVFADARSSSGQPEQRGSILERIRERFKSGGPSRGGSAGRLRDLLTRSVTGELQPGEKLEKLTWDGIEREYIVHLPPGHPGNRKWPLVLLFHGGGGNAGQALDQYGLREAADRHGFVLVAPNGTGRIALRTWNVKFGFGYAKENEVDDVGFVRALLEQLANTLSIDLQRVFATGISNGGILCHFLAAELSGSIAAIAPVVGTVGGKADDQGDWQMPSAPTTPVSVIAFNGAKDDHVPLEGGRQRKSFKKAAHMKSAQETALFWARANGCVTTATITKDAAHGSTIHRFGGGRAGSEVELWVIHDQGHAWPGGKRPRLQSDLPSTLVDANELMWSFFERHPRW